MKRLNDFVNKAPMWKIYILGWFFTGAFTASIFYGFRLIDPPSSKMAFSGINCIKMGALSGLLFGLTFSLMVTMARKSTIFWEYAEEVENLINKANSKDALQSIFDNEFQDLRKKCQGGLQIPELNRLYTIMKTKYQYI